MTILLHGDNEVDSRLRLTEIKGAFDGEVVTMLAPTATKTDFTVAVETRSLFAKKRLIIVENLTANMEVLSGLVIPAGGDFVLWEGKKLSFTQIEKIRKIFSSLSSYEFKYEKVVFQFLSAIKPGNRKEALRLLGKYRQSESSEVILVMMARQFRLLLLAKSSGNRQSGEWNSLAPWQRARLREQAVSFPSGVLEKVYGELLKIDYGQKSGQAVVDLGTGLELLLVSL